MNTNVVLGLLGAAVGIGALVVASSSSASTTPASSGSSCANLPALPTGYTWQPVTGNITPGMHLRISMTAQNFQTVAQSLAGAGTTPATGIAGWTNLLATPQVAQVLGTSNICAWAPGQALPLDWPADDNDAQSEYHADFVYQGTATLAASSFPFPASMWAATPPTSAAATAPTTGVVTPGPVVYPGQTPVTTNPTPATTNPQTAHLVAPGGNVNVTGTLPGTPITIVIDGGGSFTDVTSSSATKPQALPTLPFFVYTTPDASGTITLQWQDASGNAYSSTVTYS